MSASRKEIEAFILKNIEKMIPGSQNAPYYEEYFSTLSDKEFDAMLDKLEEGTMILCIVDPNLTPGNHLSIERNLKHAEELGLELFEQIWMDPGNGEPKYLSNDKYLVVPLPLCRQAQLQQKKISVPKDNKSINDYTGQPSGKSASSRISYPEMLVLQSFGFDANLEEFYKWRGGDLEGMRAMDAQFSKTGAASVKSLGYLNTKVTSTNTLYTLMVGMHLDNTLLKT